MLDRVKELIGEVAAFSSDKKEEIESFRIKYLGTKKVISNNIRCEFHNTPQLPFQLTFLFYNSNQSPFLYIHK